MKIRKQVYKLTLDDFNTYPAWEFALDEESEKDQDEATVRPYEFSGLIDPSDGMFVVRASFLLADGSPMQGYLTPQNGGDRLGLLQPIIIAGDKQVGFWCGILKPSPEQLAKWYLLLGRNASQVFPLQFKSNVNLVRGPVQGMITGFMFYEDYKAGKVKALT